MKFDSNGELKISYSAGRGKVISDKKSSRRRRVDRRAARGSRRYQRDINSVARYNLRTTGRTDPTATQKLIRNQAESIRRQKIARRASARSSVLFGASVLGQVFLPFLFIIFFFNYMVSDGDSTGLSFLGLLESLQRASFDNSFLITTLKNFSAIASWSKDYSGVLAALVTIGEVAVGAGNIILLIFALLGSALQVVRWIFGLLAL